MSVTKVGAVTSTTTNSVFYPSATYSESAVGTSAPSTKTRHIFLFGNSVATIETTPLVVGTTTTTTTAVTYTHSDHLGSANVVSDSAGNPIETLAYSPYGATSGDIKTPSPLSPATFSEQRTYIGQYADAGTGLSYLNARYYSGDRGQFLSQDPVFWEVGLSKDGKSVLENPQAQNSYSYANDNPIGNKDPNGRLAPLLVAGLFGMAGGVGSQAFSDYLTGDLGNRTLKETVATYGVAVVSGATVGMGTASVGLVAEAYAASAVAKTLITGATAGVLNAGTTVAGNAILKQKNDWGNIAVNSIISTMTAGTLKMASGINGKFWKVGASKSAYLARQGAEELAADSIQTLGQTTKNLFSSISYSSGASRGVSSGGGYGSSGSTYTSFMPANRNTACGKLCM